MTNRKSPPPAVAIAEETSQRAPRGYQRKVRSFRQRDDFYEELERRAEKRGTSVSAVLEEVIEAGLRATGWKPKS